MFNNRQVIQLNHLYRLSCNCDITKMTYKPFIYINTGTVDVYGCGSLTQPATIGDMTLEEEQISVDGFDTFELIPTYICVKANEGTPTEIVIAGLKVEDLGELE